MPPYFEGYLAFLLGAAYGFLEKASWSWDQLAYLFPQPKKFLIFQRMPFEVGNWDKAMNVKKKVWRGRSVRFPRDEVSG